MTGTSGRQRVSASVFDHYLIPVPTREVELVFGNIANGLLQTIKANDEQSGTLAALRDTLLPRLISGQLRVPEVEEQVSRF